MYRAMLRMSWRKGLSAQLKVSWREGALSNTKGELEGALSNAEGELEGAPTVWRVSG